MTSLIIVEKNLRFLWASSSWPSIVFILSLISSIISPLLWALLPWLVLFELRCLSCSKFLSRKSYAIVILSPIELFFFKRSHLWLLNLSRPKIVSIKAIIFFRMMPMLLNNSAPKLKPVVLLFRIKLSFFGLLNLPSAPRPAFVSRFIRFLLISLSWLFPSDYKLILIFLCFIFIVRISIPSNISKLIFEFWLFMLVCFNRLLIFSSVFRVFSIRAHCCSLLLSNLSHLSLLLQGDKLVLS